LTIAECGVSSDLTCSLASSAWNCSSMIMRGRTFGLFRSGTVAIGLYGKVVHFTA